MIITKTGSYAVQFYGYDGWYTKKEYPDTPKAEPKQLPTWMVN